MGSIVRRFVKKVASIWDGIENIAEDLWDSIQESVDDSVDWIEERAEDISEDVSEFTQDVYDSVRDFSIEAVAIIPFSGNYYSRQLELAFSAAEDIAQETRSALGHIRPSELFTDPINSLEDSYEHVENSIGVYNDYISHSLQNFDEYLHELDDAKVQIIATVGSVVFPPAAPYLAAAVMVYNDGDPEGYFEKLKEGDVSTIIKTVAVVAGASGNFGVSDSSWVSTAAKITNNINNITNGDPEAFYEKIKDGDLAAIAQTIAAIGSGIEEFGYKINGPTTPIPIQKILQTTQSVTKLYDTYGKHVKLIEKIADGDFEASDLGDLNVLIDDVTGVNVREKIVDLGKDLGAEALEYLSENALGSLNDVADDLSDKFKSLEKIAQSLKEINENIIIPSTDAIGDLSSQIADELNKAVGGQLEIIKDGAINTFKGLEDLKADFTDVLEDAVGSDLELIGSAAQDLLENGADYLNSTLIAKIDALVEKLKIERDNHKRAVEKKLVSVEDKDGNIIEKGLTTSDYYLLSKFAANVPTQDHTNIESLEFIKVYDPNFGDIIEVPRSVGLHELNDGSQILVTQESLDSINDKGLSIFAIEREIIKSEITMVGANISGLVVLKNAIGSMFEKFGGKMPDWVQELTDKINDNLSNKLDNLAQEVGFYDKSFSNLDLAEKINKLELEIKSEAGFQYNTRLKDLTGKYSFEAKIPQVAGVNLEADIGVIDPETGKEINYFNAGVQVFNIYQDTNGKKKLVGTYGPEKGVQLTIDITSDIPKEEKSLGFKIEIPLGLFDISAEYAYKENGNIQTDKFGGGANVDLLNNKFTKFLRVNEKKVKEYVGEVKAGVDFYVEVESTLSKTVIHSDNLDLQQHNTRVLSIDNLTPYLARVSPWDELEPGSLTSNHVTGTSFIDDTYSMIDGDNSHYTKGAFYDRVFTKQIYKEVLDELVINQGFQASMVFNILRNTLKIDPKKLSSFILADGNFNKDLLISFVNSEILELNALFYLNNYNPLVNNNFFKHDIDYLGHIIEFQNSEDYLNLPDLNQTINIDDSIISRYDERIEKLAIHGSSKTILDSFVDGSYFFFNNKFYQKSDDDAFVVNYPYYDPDADNPNSNNPDGRVYYPTPNQGADNPPTYYIPTKVAVDENGNDILTFDEDGIIPMNIHQKDEDGKFIQTSPKQDEDDVTQSFDNLINKLQDLRAEVVGGLDLESAWSRLSSTTDEVAALLSGDLQKAWDNVLSDFEELKSLDDLENIGSDVIDGKIKSVDDSVKHFENILGGRVHQSYGWAKDIVTSYKDELETFTANLQDLPTSTINNNFSFFQDLASSVGSLNRSIDFKIDQLDINHIGQRLFDLDFKIQDLISNYSDDIFSKDFYDKISFFKSELESVGNYVSSSQNYVQDQFSSKISSQQDVINKISQEVENVRIKTISDFMISRLKDSNINQKFLYNTISKKVSSLIDQQDDFISDDKMQEIITASLNWLNDESFVAGSKTRKAVLDENISPQRINSDTIYDGTNSSDYFYGANLSKYSRVNAGDGDDYIRLDNTIENVSLMGGGGNDYIVYNDTFDKRGALIFMDGGDGNDFLKASDGDNAVRLNGEAGNDQIFISNMSDGAYASGGDGDDYIHYDKSPNVSGYGGAGNDLIQVEGNYDLSFFDGGDGDDVIIIGVGHDYVNGESGNDSIIQEFGDGDEILIGGEGDDSYYFNAHIGNDEIDDDNGNIYIADKLLKGTANKTDIVGQYELNHNGYDYDLYWQGSGQKLEIIGDVSNSDGFEGKITINHYYDRLFNIDFEVNNPISINDEFITHKDSFLNIRNDAVVSNDSKNNEIGDLKVVSLSNSILHEDNSELQESSTQELEFLGENNWQSTSDYERVKLSNGNHVIMWSDTWKESIFAVLVDENLGQIGDVFEVTLEDDNYKYDDLKIKPLSNGGFVVGWFYDEGVVRYYEGTDISYTANSRNIAGKVYNSTAAQIEKYFNINVDDLAATPRYLNIDVIDDKFAVSWSSYSDYAYSQFFNINGDKINKAISYGQSTYMHAAPSVQKLDDDKVQVSWIDGERKNIDPATLMFDYTINANSFSLSKLDSNIDNIEYNNEFSLDLSSFYFLSPTSYYEIIPLDNKETMVVWIEVGGWNYTTGDLEQDNVIKYQILDENRNIKGEEQEIGVFLGNKEGVSGSPKVSLSVIELENDFKLIVWGGDGTHPRPPSFAPLQNIMKSRLVDAKGNIVGKEFHIESILQSEIDYDSNSNLHHHNERDINLIQLGNGDVLVSWIYSGKVFERIINPLHNDSVITTKNGLAAINEDDSITFYPDEGFLGREEFYVKVENERGGFDNSLVTIDVLDDNPRTYADAVNLVEDEEITFSVFANDKDLVDDMSSYDQDNIEIITQPTNGKTIINDDGTITYKPNDDYFGDDEFIYKLIDNDGNVSNEAKVKLHVTNKNDAPIINSSNSIYDLQILQNNEFSYTLKEGAFIDVDGDDLIYTSKLKNGDDLPSWLNFNESSGTFSGIAPKDLDIDSSKFEIEISASDGVESVSENFILNTQSNVISSSNIVNGEITGTKRNDEIVTSGGSDTLTGGEGEDTFTISTKEENITTTITDFKTASQSQSEFGNISSGETLDISLFEGITDFSDLTITEGSAIVHLGNGQTIHILGITPDDLSADDFVFADNKAPDITKINANSNNSFLYDDTILESLSQNQSALPSLELVDGRAVDVDPIANSLITANKAGEVIVTFKNSVARYNSSVGYYLIAEDGTITNPKLLFKGAHNVAGETQFSLGNLEAGQKIGFFILADGAGKNAWWRTLDKSKWLKYDDVNEANGTFSFINEADGSLANVYNSVTPKLMFTNTTTNESYEALGKHTYHSYNNNNLNSDNLLHSGAGWDETRQELLIGFEDSHGSGEVDSDYNDVLFYLKMNSSPSSNTSNTNTISAPSLNIQISDANDINEAVIDITNNIQGDRLVFSNGDFTIDQNSKEVSKVTIDNTDSNNPVTTTTNLGITLTVDETDNSKITISGEQTSEVYQELISSIRFVHVKGDANQTEAVNFTRNINISVTDEDDVTTDATTSIIIMDKPLTGTNISEVLNGTINNDLIVAKDGDDTIDAKAGDDSIKAGMGQDNITGGEGDDTFIFTSLEESTINKTDVIEDFTQGEDILDLSQIESIDELSDLEIVTQNGFTQVKDKNSDFQVNLAGSIGIDEDDFWF